MERRYRVIIIGAGIAGLSCAKYLLENDIHDFLIVEAQDRIGGRCQTIPLLEQHVELGVELLHGDRTNNPLYQLAEENHLLDIDDKGSDRDDCYHDEDAESIDEDVVDEVRKVYDEILEKKVPTYPYENYPDLSLGEFIWAEFDQYMTLKKSILEKEELDERQKVINWLHKQHPWLNTIGSNRLTDVSVQGWNSLERLPKDDEHHDGAVYLQHGFLSFLHKVFLRQQMDEDQIQFNTAVQCISMHEEEQYVDIEVLHHNQHVETYRAKHVVCTQSVGCLKQTMQELFVPPLPQSKRMCIQKLGFGTINRIYLVYSQPFWDADFDGFHFLWDINGSNNEWELESLSETPFDNQWCKSLTGFYVHHQLANVLTTEISGEAAKYIETIPDDLLAVALQELLGHFYPDNPSPLPEQLVRSQWFNDPFARGSHTFIKLGSSIHDIKQLAMPWPNKPTKPLVLFAGEGTHDRFYGTAHGAYLTGVREAKRLVQLYKT